MSPASTPTTFHVHMPITAVIQHARSPRRLDGMFLDRETKRPLTGEEVLTIAHDLASKGFDVIPPCDHHDAKGRCLGHQTEGVAA